MRGVWRGDSDPLELINGKEYDIISIEWNGQMANVVDETGDNFLYPLEDFQIVDENADGVAKTDKEIEGRVN